MIRINKQQVIDAEVLSDNTLIFDDFLKLNHGYENEVELWETNRNWSFDVNKFVQGIKDDYVNFCNDNGFKTYFIRKGER